MMYMMAFALLAVILSIQVQAGPIPIPAAEPEPDAATFEAMDPTKMEVFERAEDATAKFIAKRALTNDKIAVRAEPEAAVTFDAMDPTKREVFERAEDATAKFIAKRDVAVETGDPGANPDDAAIGTASVTDDTAEKHKAAVNIIPIPPPIKPCPVACPMVRKPLCAHNRRGEKRTFGNACELGIWNCQHPYDVYVEEHEGECDDK
ncbi:hypothetical protein BGZ96_011891 [Linnemannia gamsii]|uniref:Kazal-like domain-containing protein n=1 Tax=Linnemannia gamsii TaxID=64522 RepID=A0ABQ7JS03_9FUNG|nr:hypothetical protein BGZ96_011891 [Linnemannia gamsii]